MSFQKRLVDTGLIPLLNVHTFVTYEIAQKAYEKVQKYLLIAKFFWETYCIPD